MTLLREIENHCSTTGETASAFGRNAVGDPRLVFDLRKGRELRQRNLQRVRDYIATGKPYSRRGLRRSAEQVDA
jgi:hypothetical protein